MPTPCDQVHARGWTVLPAELSSAEIALARDAIGRAWRRAGAPGPGGCFGFVMHPLFAHAPELAPLLARGRVMDVLRGVLGGPVRLAHNGGLLGDAGRGFTRWHEHRDDPEGRRPARQGRIARLLANIYLDGSGPELGELLVRERALGDPLAPPAGALDAERPDQVVVRCPPGSVVVFDQSLWHAARPARVDAPRRIIGGHYQAWSDATPHREDNPCDQAEVVAMAAEHALLAELVLGRPAPLAA